MLNDLLTSKIELLEEQIENLERSGFFTEKEIDSKTTFLKQQIELHKQSITVNLFCEAMTKSSENILQFAKKAIEMNAAREDYQQFGILSQDRPLYGMTPEEYQEAGQQHNDLFDQIKEIKVNDSQTISPTK